MTESIGGHAGVRVLEIKDLRGISMDNYVSKMDIRCLKKCRKRNTLEDTRLRMQLKVDEKVRDIFSNNLKVHEEATAKKLMQFRMAWDDIHAKPYSEGYSQSHLDLRREKTTEKESFLPKLPRSKTMYQQTPLITERSTRARDHLLVRQNTCDKKIIKFMNAKWYANKDETDIGEFDRKIPLTLKQQRFLAKLQGLLVPKMEPKKTGVKKGDSNHSRLWVNLPYSMDGGATGDEIRHFTYKIDDAPVLEISPDKLATSKKPETMTTWIGLETAKEVEHFMEVRSKTIIEEEEKE